MCVGSDLSVTTATPTFSRHVDWSITKDVDKTLVGQPGGTRFTYTVVAQETDFHDSGWHVSGAIRVTNPNA